MENIEQFLIQKIEELSFTEISKDDLLWTDKILDSIIIVELAVAIEIQFGIKIPNADIIVENFDSIDLIAEYIIKAKGWFFEYRKSTYFPNIDGDGYSALPFLFISNKYQSHFANKYDWLPENVFKFLC